jgi:Tfp pilus assembly protein FimT
VVLAIMATMATVVGLTLTLVARNDVETEQQRFLTLVRTTRESALRSGRPVHVSATLRVPGVRTDSSNGVAGLIEITALPDGRLITDPSAGVDLLTGRSRRASDAHGP